MANYTGSAAVTTITVKNNAGTLTNATTLTAYLRPPGKTQEIYVQPTTGTWTNPSTGSYTFSFTPDIPGTWRLGITAEHATFTADAAVNIEITTLAPFD